MGSDEDDKWATTVVDAPYVSAGSGIGIKTIKVPKPNPGSTNAGGKAGDTSFSKMYPSPAHETKYFQDNLFTALGAPKSALVLEKGSTEGPPPVRYPNGSVVAELARTARSGETTLERIDWVERVLTALDTTGSKHDIREFVHTLVHRSLGIDVHRSYGSRVSDPDKRQRAFEGRGEPALTSYLREQLYRDLQKTPSLARTIADTHYTADTSQFSCAIPAGSLLKTTDAWKGNNVVKTSSVHTWGEVAAQSHLFTAGIHVGYDTFDGVVDADSALTVLHELVQQTAHVVRHAENVYAASMLSGIARARIYREHDFKANPAATIDSFTDFAQDNGLNPDRCIYVLSPEHLSSLLWGAYADAPIPYRGSYCYLGRPVVIVPKLRTRAFLFDPGEGCSQGGVYNYDGFEDTTGRYIVAGDSPVGGTRGYLRLGTKLMNARRSSKLTISWNASMYMSSNPRVVELGLGEN